MFTQNEPVAPARAGDSGERCHRCGRRGKAIDKQTIKALLDVSLEVLRLVNYRFCATPDCPNVYFAEDGSHAIHEDQLRVRVYQKHPGDDDVLVCYCFFHSPRSVRTEIAAHGATNVVERVTALTQAQACACDVRNPKGSCCLNDLRQLVQRITAGR